MDTAPGAAPMPSSEGHIVIAESETEDERARLMLNNPSPTYPFTAALAQPTDSDNAAPDSTNSPSLGGRKRRLSFKEKQRQSISHFGSTTTKSTLPSNVNGDFLQSPTSTASSSSPQQLGMSPTSSQSLQPARKKTTTDTAAGDTTATTNPSAGHSVTRCVFTALEPTRSGLRGAARPPNRNPASHAARPVSSSTPSVSPATSTEPSPVDKPRSSSSERISATLSLVHSPLAASSALQANDTAASNTSSLVSPLTAASPCPTSTATEGRHAPYSKLVGGRAATLAGAAADVRSLMEVLRQPSDSLVSIVSAPSVSSPKMSSSSSFATSRKLSFKDRQRAAVAATSRNPSTRGSMSSPVSQTSPTTAEALLLKDAPPEASKSFLMQSPNCSLAVAERSVNQGKSLPKASPMPATAAIVAPAHESHFHVDPVTVGLSTGSGNSGGGSAFKEGNSPTQSLPRLPIDRIRTGLSPHPLCTAAPQSEHGKRSGEADPNSSTSQRVAAAPTSPLMLPAAPAGPVAPSCLTAKPSSSNTQGPQSASATSTWRHSRAAATSGELLLQPHVNALTSSPLQRAEDMTGSTYPTIVITDVTEAQSRSSQADTHSSHAENDDERNGALAFTQNIQRLHLYDLDEPSPRGRTVTLPHTCDGAEGNSTRPDTMVAKSASSARWGPGSQQSARTEEGSEEDPMHAGESCSSGGRNSRSSCGGGVGDRRAFAARRARTGSLGSPPPNVLTFPPSPLPGAALSTSPSSHSPRKVPTSERTQPGGRGGRRPNAVIGHWKQRHQSPQQYQQQRLSHTAGSSFASLADASDLSVTLGDARLGSSGRARARRHRDKMLAPDGTVLSTPRTGHGPGGEGGGSAFVTIPDSRIHSRSRTADGLIPHAGDTGRRGALTPSMATSSSARYTHAPTLATLVLPAPGSTVGAATQGGGASVAGASGERLGPLDASDMLPRQSLTHSPSTNDTVVAASFGDGGGSGGRATDQPGSSQSRGLVSFPRLPPLHDHTSSASSALSRAPLHHGAMLLPGGPSAESISVVTPVTVATPNGYRSGDERSSNDASCGNQTEVYTYGSIEERGHTPLPEDLVHGEGDYLLQTYNTYYGGEASLSATTAELRKSRRRSNYSSLHYGTMTGYRHRGDSRRPRSGSAVLRGRRQRGTSERPADAEGEENEERKVLTVKLTGQRTLEERSNAIMDQGVHYSNNDDEESICEQKGSEEDRDKEAAEENSRSGVAGHNKLTPHGQHHYRSQNQRSAGDQLAVADEVEDDTEDGQRRTVGIWETIEHVFLPQYELVSEAESKKPPAGLTLSSSPHQSGTGSTGRPGLTTEDSSPLAANLKGNSPSPNTLSNHGLQPIPTVLLSSLPAQPKSPFFSDTAPPAMPPLPSAEQSPSVGPSGAPSGPRLSGLVVLPDAANLSEDPSSSASLTFSQFRKTSGKIAGAKRLEPEKFTFGTVAATYNMEPVDEQRLPDGAADSKVAARLIFDASAGVMLMDPEDEGGRFAQHGRTSPDAHSRSSSPKNKNEESEEDAGGEDGACRCEACFITKDFKGLDCGRYDASDLYDHCSRCHRRPAAFLCLHCMEAVCPSHVQRHHLLNPTQCTLFLNLLDIMSSFDRIFWCEKCKQFTWKYTEVYDALVDQIAYTRGTYLKHPARDIHCVGYEVRLKDATTQATEAAAIKARSEPSMNEDAASSHRDSSVRQLYAVGGPSLYASLHSIAPNPALATFPKLCGTAVVAPSLPLRCSTPPLNVTSSSNRPAAVPSMLGVNNLIVFGASLSSPVGGNGTASLMHSNAVGTPSLHPLKSPMHTFLNRDPLEMSGGRAVTVGEPVTKLCALGASVQGWRTTQEDAEAAFLVDIPALSNEVVNQKELHAVAAAAAEKQKQQQQQDHVQGGSPDDSEKRRKRSANEENLCGSAQDTDKSMPHSHSESRRDSSLVAHEAHDLESSASSHLPVLDGTLRASDMENVKEAQKANAESAPQRQRPRAASLDKREGGDDGKGKEPTETIPMAVFCVFDGHGGDAVAKLAARHFETHLRRAIDGTRADDVRARALLFYLNAESNAASLLGLQPAVTAIPSADGSITFLPANSSAAFAAAQRATVLTALSPPALATSPPNPSTSPHSGPTVQSSSSRSKLLVPGNQLLLPYSREEADPLQPLPPMAFMQEGAEDSDAPQNILLPDAMYAESVPVVLPVTTESLRLHMAGSVVNFPGAGVGGTEEEGALKAPRSNSGEESAGAHTHRLSRHRRSRATLDAWADMEDLQSEMATPAAAAAAASASPPNPRLLPPSLAAACSPDFRHFGNTSSFPQAAMAASTTFCSSPSAWVSIPEMEMLRQYFASIMEDALLSLDDYLRTTPEGVRGDYDCVGCTACVVGITANFVLCANVGDSGAAFYTKDRIKVISVKHRVSDEAEQKRINAAGYAIVNDRIEGMSAVPRALGDFDFKQCGGRGPREQAVSAVPDVTIMPTPSDTDQWGIILACDGVWDTATLHQVHVALTNTVNDLDVASSATEAVLRGAELYQHRLRGPGAPRADPPSHSPQHSATSLEGSGENGSRSSCDAVGRSRDGSASPSPAKRRALISEEDGEGSVIGDYECEEGGVARRLPQLDPILLTAAAGVFAQCVAPADNDEGVGLDNCSLIIVERRNVQE